VKNFKEVDKIKKKSQGTAMPIVFEGSGRKKKIHTHIIILPN
jgi:hypothetical protein